MFSKKKTIQNTSGSSVSLADKLEKMEIEQDSKPKKGKTGRDWEPWSFSHVQRITDEELWKWNQAYQQEQKSQAQDRLLSVLKDLLLGNDPKESENL